MITLPQLDDLRDAPALSADGKILGKVEDVYVDAGSGERSGPS